MDLPYLISHCGQQCRRDFLMNVTMCGLSNEKEDLSYILTVMQYHSS